LAQRPRAQVDLIEASAKMIEQAKQRVPGGAVVAFEQVDVLECARSDRYDLIVSHFFLDCFELEQIEQIVTRFTANLEPGGEWLIADFQIPENGRFWRLRARCLLWIMYRFFRLMTGLRAPALLDPQPVLEAAGLVLDRRVVSNCGFIRSDRWKRKR
jgi:ubiquinone/menaquinone biosynthesis C-methylase UbiE